MALSFINKQKLSQMKTKIICIAQHINATEQEIFDFFTKADLLEKWFATEAITHPVKEGEYRFNFQFTDPQMAAIGNHTRNGHFVEIIPSRTICFDWIDRTLVTITLSKTDHGCRIELVHSGWKLPKDNAEYNSHIEQWTDFLRNLKSVIEEGIDHRPGRMGMKTKEHPAFVNEI